MRSFPFQQVDVFTEVPFKGNPVAVVFDADGLSTAEMQAIANWTNLSETVFVCRPGHPDADYLLRLFTPQSELPFAGHPTIGTAHAVLRHGLTGKSPGRLIQECGKGLIAIRIEGDQFFLALPTPTFRMPDATELASAASALGVSVGNVRAHAIVDVGPVWLTMQLRDGEQVLSLKPDLAQVAALKTIGIIGITVFGVHAVSVSSDVEVRSFAPSEGVPEDPVCGSGNGCVAAVIQRHGVLPLTQYTSSQGRCLGRDGRVQVRFDDSETIWVGGHAITCVDGKLNI